MFTLTDNRKIGIMLTSLGLFFMVLGVMLFFDSGLIAIGACRRPPFTWQGSEPTRPSSTGDILFLASFPFLVGVQKSVQLFNPFAKGNSMRGIAAFFVGVVLVLLKWGLVGMLLQAAGLVDMFGTFFWRIVDFLRGMPYVSTVLNFPGIKQVVDLLANASAKPLESKV